MCVGLHFWSLQLCLNSKCLLQEVEGGPHLSNSAVVASHIVVGHCLAELVVLAELLGLLQQVECRIYIFLLEVVNCKNVANFA